MHIFYVDESYDLQKVVLTAVFMEDAHWRPAFEATKEFRRQLAKTHGIYVYKELHAHSFIRDCSDGISKRAKLSLAVRRQIFESVLTHMRSLPIRVLNVCLDVARWGTPNRTHEICVERLANRVQATMKAEKSYAVIVFDEGRQYEITRLTRKMSVFNYIPSRFGTWQDTGDSHKNIRVDRLIEDPVFKPSHASYFLQLADFAAFSLLKQETTATPFATRWGYNTLFPILRPVLFLRAAGPDPMGIVR